MAQDPGSISGADDLHTARSSDHCARRRQRLCRPLGLLGSLQLQAREGMEQVWWELPWKPRQTFLVRADPAKWHFGALAPTRLPKGGHSTLAEDILGSPWGWDTGPP